MQIKKNAIPDDYKVTNQVLGSGINGKGGRGGEWRVEGVWGRYGGGVEGRVSLVDDRKRKEGESGFVKVGARVGGGRRGGCY